MAYIGKSPTGTGVRSRYYFTASGGETSLSGADDSGATLSFTDGAYVDVSLNGVALVAGTDYNTTTANTIGGLSALSASDIVEILVYDVFTVADTVSASAGGTFSGDVVFTGAVTGVITKATSDPTTSTNGTQGDLYLNKTSGEMWCLTDATTNANVWTNIGDGSGDIKPTYTAKLLLVAGGGGGGTTSGGGGGGGEVLFASSFTLTKGNTYSVTVGAGGVGAVYNTSASDVGGNTSFGSAATAIGGGGGGTAATSPTVGGSGGGASSASGSTGAAASGTSVSGFTTYGNAGGDNAGGTASAAGGGGAGGAGGNAGVSGNVGGVGGVGIDLSSHFGTSVGADNGYFAGGGGGGSQSNVGGGAAAGGLGGGGTAQASASTGQAGTANTGGGGAGGGWSTNYGDGGNGGSGVVIIRYSGSQQGTGGTVTSPSGDTMHVFTSSGTFTA
jgi:hypothetical protein